MRDPVCALIGAGPGLGLALAERFGRGGFRLALVGRRPNALDELTGRLTVRGIAARGFAADAGAPDSLHGAVRAIAGELGPPQVLLYNAVAARQANPSALTPPDLVDDFMINVVGALVAAQAVLAEMRTARRGSILFTGGGFAFEPLPIFASLSIGKAAIRNLCFSLARELESDGIHVATVTVCGTIAPNTPFDPARIAEAFWTLHTQPLGAWEREIVFRG